MKVLQTRIAEYRRVNNVTQSELAEKVDVRRETIARLERGLYNPSLKLAYDIAQYFDTSIEDMFTYVDIEETD